LESERYLNDYNIVHQDIVHLVLRLRVGMQIIIKSYKDNYLLDVKTEDTIKDIKYEIQEREGILINKQRLFCDGEELEDARTLESYNISKVSAIHLVIE